MAVIVAIVPRSDPAPGIAETAIVPPSKSSRQIHPSRPSTSVRSPRPTVVPQSTHVAYSADTMQ